jgi:hypothetical protein
LKYPQENLGQNSDQVIYDDAGGNGGEDDHSEEGSSFCDPRINEFATVHVEVSQDRKTPIPMTPL